MAIPVKIYNTGGQQVATTGTGTATDPIQAVSTTSGTESTGFDWNPLNWITPPSDRSKGLAPGVSTLSQAASDTEDLAKAATFVTDPANWLRLGEIIAGGILMLIGVIGVAYTLGGKQINEIGKVLLPDALGAEIIGNAVKKRAQAPARRTANRITEGKPSTGKHAKPKVEYRSKSGSAT